MTTPFRLPVDFEIYATVRANLGDHYTDADGDMPQESQCFIVSESPDELMADCLCKMLATSNILSRADSDTEDNTLLTDSLQRRHDNLNSVVSALKRHGVALTHEWPHNDSLDRAFPLRDEIIPLIRTRIAFDFQSDAPTAIHHFRVACAWKDIQSYVDTLGQIHKVSAHVSHSHQQPMEVSVSGNNHQTVMRITHSILDYLSGFEALRVLDTRI